MAERAAEEEEMTYDAKTKDRTRTDFLVVHCSASPPKTFVDASVIDRWHRQRGFKCIGYHKVILRDGTVQDGRPLDQIGAHVEGWNSVSLGICLVGGVSDKDGVTPENNFTEAQFASLEVLLKELQEKYPKAKIQGHRDFPKVAKACPSFSVADWLKTTDIKNR